MFYVSPEIKPKFDALSPELRNAISEKGMPLHSIHDLIKVLEDIANEG